MKRKHRKIAVGLSGGVDSSVAAALLKASGDDVIGITMQIFDGSADLNETEKHACYGPGENEDIQAAESVCKKLGIPFHVIDLRKEYLSGRTPNPCIVCNRHLKFGFLIEKARQIGIDFDGFATGHYAEIVCIDNRYLLKKAKDTRKDQTYFLYSLSSDQLSRTIFPLGPYLKAETRKIARELGLEIADRIESQDFIAGGDYSCLFDADEITPGDIVDETGKVLGKHRGIIHYTLGQRQGLGIPAKHPLYVVEIDAKNNRIVAGEKEKLFSSGLIASDLNLMAVDSLDRPYRVMAKIRLNHHPVSATVYSHEKGTAKLIFDKPEMAVTPGQSVVMYVDDTVFGGGIIEKAIKSEDLLAQ